MPSLAVHSFLGEVARPHYEAVTWEIARRTGAALEPLRETPLAELDAVVEGPPALLFVCGLPYTRMRDSGASIVPLAAPVPDDEEGPFYCADLLVGAAATQTAPEQLRGERVAFNGDDSLSGWVMPRDALRGLGIDPDDYAWVPTGSHRNSLAALVRGDVVAAPIDSTVLALERREDPALAGLRRIARLGHMPSPPVALTGSDAGLAASLRAALVALGDSDEGRAALALGAIRRFEPATDADYAPVRAADAAR